MQTRKILLIGGTGTISTAVVTALGKDIQNEIVVLNRGHKQVPSYVQQIVCDVNEEDALGRAVAGDNYDVVIDFLVYDAKQAQERVRIFQGHVRQYFFISTVVTFNHEHTVWLNENSVQKNRFSRYGQNKKLAEDVFRQAYENGFPVTIVRPSQTYSTDRIPLSVKGKSCWSVVSRIVRGKSVIVHGDGKAIWHMMHSSDFAYNFVQLIGNPNAIGKSVNLVNPAVVTWDMIYEEIAKQLGTKLKICHIASDTLACSNKYDNIETILGDKQFSNMYGKGMINQLIPDFRCSVDLQQGIAMYLSNVEAHPELKVEDAEYDEWCDTLIHEYHRFMKMVAQNY